MATSETGRTTECSECGESKPNSEIKGVRFQEWQETTVRDEGPHRETTTEIVNGWKPVCDSCRDGGN